MRVSEVRRIHPLMVFKLKGLISLAAITMTLCEIATGDHASPPLECEPFQFNSNAPYETQLETGRKCVSYVTKAGRGLGMIFKSTYQSFVAKRTVLVKLLGVSPRSQ